MNTINKGDVLKGFCCKDFNWIARMILRVLVWGNCENPKCPRNGPHGVGSDHTRESILQWKENQ